MKMEETEYLVDGYRFSTKEEADLARQEKQKIATLKQKMDYNDVSSVAMLYEKAVRNQVFVTPVGFNFLHEVQEFLNEQKRTEGLLAIPVGEVAVLEEAESIETENTESENEELQKEEEPVLEEVKYEPGKVRNYVMVESLQKQVKKQTASIKQLKGRYRMSIILNLFLAAIIVLLFWITITGENTNALNYKRVLNNKYASWEEELKEREAVIREKERELQITIEENAN